MEYAGLSRIVCRNRRQTMDWALVLASQGIEAVIDGGDEGWGLIVKTTDYPAAVEAVRLYRLENRRWRWRQNVGQEFVFDWGVLIWVALLVLVFMFSQTIRLDWERSGCMDNSAVLSGEWWRLFTAVLLHANVAHLAANLAFGAILLGLAMGRFGWGMGLLAAYLAGVMGNVAGLLIYPGRHLGVGASGMVMGGLGLLAVQSLSHFQEHPVRRKLVARSFSAGVILFALYGLSPESDVVA